MWCHIRGDYAVHGTDPHIESTCPLRDACPLRGTVTLTQRAFTLDAVAAESQRFLAYQRVAQVFLVCAAVTQPMAIMTALVV